MGRRKDANKDKKEKKRVTLSLAEFNENAGLGGTNPELAALPSAPKAPEQWEAEGGRPEYNSRGYKERSQSLRERRSSRSDFDDDDHDWARVGPVDARRGGFSGGGGGGGGGADEADWGAMRRDSAGVAGDDNSVPDRDWNDMRRTPVDSVGGSGFSGKAGGSAASGGEPDWGARAGPVEADLPSGPRALRSDEDWASSRRTTVEAEFGPLHAETDWSVRKGPVEAEGDGGEGGGGGEAADWSMRKGPVESTFEAAASQEKDWSLRKGPVEADVPPMQTVNSDERWADARGKAAPVEAAEARQVQHDWSDVRRGATVEAASAPEVAAAEGERMSGGNQAATREMDWSARRGPVESKAEEAAAAASANVAELSSSGDGANASEGSGSGGRDVDMSNMRRGSKLRSSDSGDGDEVAALPARSERGSWRREGGTGVPPLGARRGRGGAPRGRGGFSRPASTGHDSITKERDWGAARRNQPVDATPSAGDVQAAKTEEDGHAAAVEADEVAAAVEELLQVARGDSVTEDDGKGESNTDNANDDDEWTTVRMKPKRVPGHAAGPRVGGVGSGRPSSGSWRPRARGRGGGGRGGFRGGPKGGRGGMGGGGAFRPGFGMEGKAHSSPMTPPQPSPSAPTTAATTTAATTTTET